MGVLVNIGTLCRCNFGVNPLPLISPKVKNLAGNKPALNIMDIPKGVFGICNSSMNPASVAAKAIGATAPCTPAFLPPKWQPGNPKCLIGGAPALTNSSAITCAWGAPNCVIILPPGGAVTVQV